MFSTNLASANNPISDDITNHYFEDYMREAIDLGILKGVSEGVYKPDGDVTRSEFAALIVRTLEKMQALPTATQAPLTFKDVKEGAWYYKEVQTATSLGIINGYPDGTFGPLKAITRQEMSIMIERTLTAQGIEAVEANIPFTDLKNTHPMFVSSIKKVFGLKIMNGNSATTFNPLGITSRGQASAVLMRLYHLDPDSIIVDAEKQYKIARISSDGTMTVESEYTSFDEAKNNITHGQVIVHKDKVVYMDQGYAYTTAYSIVYDDANLSKERTYLSSATEVYYLDATDKAVKIKYGMHEGYISKDLVTLVPTAQVTNTSYYFVENGLLKHKIYNPVKKSYTATLEITYAPDVFVAGQKYYNFGTNEYYDSMGNAIEAPLYFANLPLHLPTNYTAEELDRYLNEKYPATEAYPTSPLAGLGATFIKVAEEYNVNALYLLAHAIHESAWGTSKIAQEKFNLFGYNAYDSDPYGSAKTYASFEESIIDAAKKVTTEYIIYNGKYFNGAVLGNKSYGMNVKYASDPLWGEKIAAHMFRADNFLGKKDFNQYKLGITTVKDLRVRDYYSAVNSNTLFTIPKAYTPFALVETTDTSLTKDENGAQWFHIHTDNPSNRQGYIFGYGQLLGSHHEYVKLFNKTY